jgi:hypothetical protein
VGGHEAQRHALAAAADHQGWMRRLHGLGLKGCVRELIVAALEGTAALRPQRANDLARLIQPLQPLAHGGKRDAIGLMLALVPAGAEAQDEPAPGDDVDLCRRLR